MSPRRLLEARNGDRLIAVVFSVWFIYSAVWLELISFEDGEKYVFFPWLWPPVFLLAGILGVLYAVHPDNRQLFAWSGGMMICALLSRAFTIVVAYLTGASPLSTPRVFLSFGAWSMLAYSVGTIWTRFLRRYQEVREHRRA